MFEFFFRTRFGLQTAVVVVAVIAVSYPEVRASAALTPSPNWRYLRTRQEAAPVQPPLQYSSSQNGRPSGPAGTDGRTIPSLPAAGLRTTVAPPASAYVSHEMAVLGARVNALRVLARSSLDTPIPFARMLLRNARTGAVEAQATADEVGQFTFLDIGSSDYIVELLGTDGALIGASGAVVAGLGVILETRVRAAAPAASVVQGFGGSIASLLPEVITTAATAGVTQAQPPNLQSSVTP